MRALVPGPCRPRTPQMESSTLAKVAFSLGVAISALVFEQVAFAVQDESLVVRTLGGQTNTYGDLSTDKPAQTWGVSVAGLLPRHNKSNAFLKFFGGVQTYVDID